MSFKAFFLIGFAIALISIIILFHQVFSQFEPIIIATFLIIALLLPRYFSGQFIQRLALLTFIAICVFSMIRVVQLVQIKPHHTHELYHYVIGGKYFSYLGYQNLYAATADVLLKHGIIDDSVKIRDLSEKTNSIDEAWQQKANHVYEMMPETVRQEFTADILFFSQVIGHQIERWQIILQDYGFNPSPIWVLEAAPFIHSIPLPQLLPWIIFIDYILLFAIVVVITLLAKNWWWRWAILAVFWFVFAYYPSVGFQSFMWITGSFLRYTWLFYVTLGIFLLVKQRYFWAGALLGLAGLERIFPLAFFGMAGLYLVVEFFKQLQYKHLLYTPLMRFSSGGLSVVLVCIVLYSAFFPTHYLHEFVNHIQAHHFLLSNNDVGYKVLAIQSGTDKGYDLWHVSENNVQQNSNSDYIHYFYNIKALLYQNNLSAQILKITLVILLALIVFQFMSLPMAVLFGGTAVIYYFTSIASYYLIFIAVYAAFAVYWYQQNIQTGDRFQIFYLLIFTGIISIMPLIQYGFESSSLSQSLGLWFLLPLLASTYLAPRWYQQLGLIVALVLILIILLLPNYRNTPTTIPPVSGLVTLIQFDGNALHQVRPEMPIVSHTYLDEYAQRIQETGAILFNQETVEFSLHLPQAPSQDFICILRSNFSYNVDLAFSVNNQTISEQHVKGVGVFWRYVSLTIPASTLQAGENTFQLHLKNGQALGIYHLWLGYIPPARE